MHPETRGWHEAARVYRGTWRCCSGMAAGGSSAATSNASYWSAARRVGSAMGGPHDCVQEGLGRGWLCRGPQPSMEYRWAGGQFDRLPAIAADLVSRVSLRPNMSK